MTLQVVTANRLDDGLAVFYTEKGDWSSKIDESIVIESEVKGEEILTQASSPENQLVVVGPYLIDIEKVNATVTPVRYREMIRTKGPSVRPDLGYQAQ